MNEVASIINDVQIIANRTGSDESINRDLLKEVFEEIEEILSELFEIIDEIEVELNPNEPNKEVQNAFILIKNYRESIRLFTLVNCYNEVESISKSFLKKIQKFLSAHQDLFLHLQKIDTNHAEYFNIETKSVVKNLKASIKEIAEIIKNLKAIEIQKIKEAEVLKTITTKFKNKFLKIKPFSTQKESPDKQN